MGIAYRLLCAVGFTRWHGPVPAPLKDMIEGTNALPARRALDLGCGKGTKSIYMATHGWDVTGVDFVPRALKEARRRAEAAGVKGDFHQGDGTTVGGLN